MSPRDQKLNQKMRAQSRSALIQAARRMFAQQGYFSCRVSDIARAAGMSTGNLYWYFESKQALLKAVLMAGFEELGDIFSRAAASRQSAVEKLHQVIGETITFGRRQGDFNRILLSLLGQGGDDLFLDLEINMEVIGVQYTKNMVSILNQAKAEGSLAEDQDPWLLAMMFFGLFNGLNLTYDQAWLDQPEQRIAAAVLRLLNIHSS